MSDEESNKILKNAQPPVASSCSAKFCFRKIVVSQSATHTSFRPIILCGQTDLYLFFFFVDKSFRKPLAFSAAVSEACCGL